MKVPRFRVAWLMALVAVVALNLGAIRAWSDYNNWLLSTTPFQPFLSLLDILVTGSLPMANVLAVGLLIGFRHRGSRPFLWGFEAFGAVALAFYIAVASLAPGLLPEENAELVIHRVHSFLVYLALRPLSTNNTSIAYWTIAAWLSLPQLAFALFGGLLSRKFGCDERPD